MATELLRRKMIEMYRETRGPTGFLASLFVVRPGNISDSETVVIDVERHGEEISPIVSPGGQTRNTHDHFTTKEFTPPTINEAMSINSQQLMNRQAGTDPYKATDVGFQEQLLSILLAGMRKLGDKIARNLEWQASQLLQTGVLNLVDAAGNVVYTIDFKPKTAHTASATTAWATHATAVPLDDIAAIGDLIRINSLQTPDQLIMGGDANINFQRCVQVKEHFDNRRMNMGGLDPQLQSSGAKFVGTVDIGMYVYQVWTYDGRGIIPGASTSVPMVGLDNCIVRASSGRLDTVYGGVPGPVRPDPRFAGMLPDRIAIPEAIAISPNVYSSTNGKNVELELESRPLSIPVGIDTFGCIDTT
jgi:hypothetical protein